MQGQTSEIQPYTITHVKVVKYFRVFVDSLELFTSARLRIDLLDENMGYVETKFVTLSGEDYTAWQTDDYIMTKVSQILGITLQNAN